MSGIEGRALGVSPNVIAGACVDNQVLHQTQADTGPVDVNRIVADLLIKVCDSAGVDPPWELAQ
jgi:hypothetical protein